MIRSDVHRESSHHYDPGKQHYHDHDHPEQFTTVDSPSQQKHQPCRDCGSQAATHGAGENENAELSDGKQSE